MLKMKRILSLLLVLALLLQILPLGVFAAPGEDRELSVQDTMEETPAVLAETEQDTAPDGSHKLEAPEYPELAPDEIAEAAEEKTYVLYEEEGFRTQDEKHFRMSDGSFMAVSYGGDVHYRDQSGHWQEIDNTLRFNKKSVADGTQGAASAEGVYETVNGDQVRQFAAVLDQSGYLFTAKSGRNSVSFSAIGGTSKAETEDTANSADTDSQNADATPDGPAPFVIKAPITAQITSATEKTEPLTDAERKERSLAEQVEPKKLTSELIYSEVWPATNLVYQPCGMDVKESIVVAKPQEAYRYAFRLTLDGLSPYTQEDGSILLCDADGKEVFVIPAPYLEDADGAVSEAAAYELEKDGACYLLTVAADEAWMNESNRAWPVVIDPTVLYITNSSNKDIITTFVNDGSLVPDVNTRKTYLRSGYYTNISEEGDLYCTGHTVGLLYFNQLPIVPQGCVVTNATLQLTQVSYGGTNNYGYHRLFATTCSISSPESTLNDMDWNDYQTGIVGYYAFGSGSQPAALDFAKETKAYGRKTNYDITPAARKWYENDTSISRLLVLDDGHNTYQNARVSYAGYMQGNFDYRPRLYVTYRNKSGVETTYSYHKQSIGRAGSGYVDDYTLNLSLSVPIIAAPSEALPFGISLVYSGNLADGDFTNNNSSILSGNYTTARLGYGWKASVQQTVVKKEYSIDGTNNQKLTYYVYTDDDGTMHYFAPQDGSTTVYEDEDGLGLKLTIHTTSSYTMEDKNGNAWEFTYGYLTTFTSNDGNKLFYAYDGVTYTASNSAWKPSNGSSAHRVTGVWRKNNGATQQKVATLTYDEGEYYQHYLTGIADAAGRKTTLSYSNGNLERINFPDGKTATYTYNNNNGFHRMTQAADNEAGYKIDYQYLSAYPLSISRYTESKKTSSSTWTTGQRVNCFRVSASYTRFRYFDAGDTGTSGKYVTQHYFDRWGRTVNVVTLNPAETEVLGVSSGTYTANEGTSKQNNHLISAASAGTQGINIALEPDFELGDVSPEPFWYYYGTGTGSITGADAAMGVSPRNGTKMMVLSASSSVKNANQRVYMQGGKTYVFSAYINTVGVNIIGSGGGAYIAIQDEFGNTNLAISYKINYHTEQNVANGWQRVEAVYTPSTSGRYMIKLIADKIGPVAFDDVQMEQVPDMEGVEETGSASTLNLLQAASFEYPDSQSGDAETAWVGNFWAMGTGISLVGDAHSGSYGVKAATDVNAKRRMIQTVSINRPGTNTYILSGWGRTPATHIGDGTGMTGDNSGNKRFFGIIAEIRYADYSATDYRYVTFNDNIEEWQYASTVIVPKRDKIVSKIIVYLALDYCANDAYFDDISLIQEPVQTYSYDENGNPLDTTNGENQTRSELDSYNRLTSYTAMDNVNYSLTYADGCYHPESITSDGLIDTCTYDAGLTTQTRTHTSDPNGVYLQSDTSYTSSTYQTKNFPVEATSVNNIERRYEYDDNKGLLKKTTDPQKSGVNTTYLETVNTYQANTDRPSSSYQTSVYYSAMKYTGELGGSGTQDQALLRQLQLKSFRSGSPMWKAYTFDYNNWGQKTAIKVSKSTDASNPTFSSGRTLATYTYDTAHRLSSTVSPNGWTVSNSYDMLDRLVHEAYTSNTSSLDRRDYYYTYNANGQLATQYAERSNTGSETERYSYEYDSLGRLIRSREERNGALLQRVAHEYDAANRLTAQYWTIGNDSFTERFTYHGSLTGDGRDGMPETFTAATGDTLTYAYDTLKRDTGYTVKYGNTTLYSVAQNYWTISGQRSSGQVKYYNWKNSAGSIVEGREHVYDADGRLISIKESTSPKRTLVSYEYDLQDQLTSETHYYYSGSSTTPVNTETIYCSYDTAGNILSRTGNGKTISYAYTDANWPDLLTSITVNGTTKTITYDQTSGNPTYWYNGQTYSGFKWILGRSLARVYTNGAYSYYDYDMAGVRTEKTVGGVVHSYVTQNGKVVRESFGTKVLDFIYDASGRPFALRYSTNSGSSFTTYYYRLNLQGDVTALITASGSEVAAYSYDAWGAPMSSTGTMASANPLRYRGYYYDTETGFYYLQSRYYDPVVRRFLNADSFVSTGQGFIGFNMFAYCDNNPLGHKDSQGGRMQNVGMTDGGGLMLTSKQDVKVTYNDSAASSLPKEKVNYYTRTYTPGFNSNCSVSSNGALTYQNHSVVNTAQMVNGAAGGVSTLYSFLNKASGSVAAAEYVAVIAVPVGVALEMLDNFKMTDNIPDGKYNSYSIITSGTRATSFPYEGHTVEHYTITLEIYEDQKNHNTYLAGYDSEEVYTYYGR